MKPIHTKTLIWSNLFHGGKIYILCVHGLNRKNSPCSVCESRRKPLKLSKGVSLYEYPSSKESLSKHNKRKDHIDAIQEVQELNDEQNKQKIRVYSEAMNAKRSQSEKKQFEKSLRPLIATAFFLCNHQIAIRKFKDLRGSLLPFIINEMIGLFKITMNETITKSMKKMINH